METHQNGLFIAPTEGKLLTNPIGGTMIAKLSDVDSNGAFSVFENVLPANSAGPHPHIHHQHEEFFYVLEGTLTLHIASTIHTAPVGSWLVVPRGMVHQPSNPSNFPTRVLLMFSPAGMDTFFDEIAQRRIPFQGAPAGYAAPADFAQKYNFEFAEFPTGSS